MKCNLINTNFTSNYVDNLLKARGVVDVEAYKTPTIEYLQSPHALKNIGRAAALYLRVVLQESPHPRILIVVDSDNDGYTSASIIYQYTQRVNCHCQIDYWLHEGKQHGLQDHIERLVAEGEHYDLIILPDSSSNDATYHDQLDELNIPCLVLDHHITDVAQSDNAIIVNNQLSPDYKNKELTGAGVVYQFCRYLDELLRQNWADDYIDLAAWGIIGDMGSVLDMENRYIITTGLSHIKNDFLHCLLDKQSYSITGKQGASWIDIVNKTNPISIAFYIVPLVNALIRVGTMEEKELLFQAFIDGSQMVPCNKRGAKGTLERADIEAARVCTNAKAHQNKMLDEIMLQVEAKIFKYDLLENKILLLELDTERFPSEINGLLAMKLSAKYKKPTLVLRAGDDYLLKGSMRGLNQSALSDFKSFLMNSGYFEWCQGHANAAGACIKSSAVEQFHTYANKALKDIDFGENIYNVNFERDVYANDLSNLVTDIARASYLWGQGNNEPLIHITNLHINSSDIRVMGANQDTLKIEFNGMPYIKFHAKDLIEEIKQHDGMMTLSLICRANLNEWMGKVTPQCIIDECEIKPYKSVVEF